eukprot:1179868-Prorocentrum_minimum.AAC.10
MEALRARRARERREAGGAGGAAGKKTKARFAAASLQFGAPGSNPGADTEQAAERELERVGTERP